MFNRKQVKANAKAAIKGHIGLAFLVSLVIGLLMSVATSTVIGGILLAGPLSAGTAFFFMKMYRKDNVSFNDSFNGFNNYKSCLVAGILVPLFTFLWSLLLIVPGIIKNYSYAMTYYILNDHPEYSATKAITESRKMMKGHKWELFVLSLSFLGWDLLSLLTLGILEAVYVIPYRSTAIAGFYDAIKDESKQ